MILKGLEDLINTLQFCWSLNDEEMNELETILDMKDDNEFTTEFNKLKDKKKEEKEGN